MSKIIDCVTFFNKKIDLYERGHKYEAVKLDSSFPSELLSNKDVHKEYFSLIK